jgi:hypothetical protein
MEQEDIKKLGCGLISCDLYEVRTLMPEVMDIINTAPIVHDQYIVDVKVHMLMPFQYPCIPNWHYDFTPRDRDGNKMFDKRNPDSKMLLWLSNPPLTEFEDGRVVNPREWIEFTQLDAHRGVECTEHVWRLFIRLTPKDIHPGARHGKDALRRHSQVYLDTKTFEW